jgi:hypothetical protein
MYSIQQKKHGQPVKAIWIVLFNDTFARNTVNDKERKKFIAGLVTRTESQKIAA